eukprot:gb/GFBE01043579.1/.p1 GENE.gb/GFBE01043579.1/~~gb/GFBE01043579.1/.p1  ORF type:complete len:568 (+),score=89.40 gb/GFBE01043579.1/:1-1704(+)
MALDSRELYMLMALGWSVLYLSVLFNGQTVPDTVKLKESWLFPGRRIGVPLWREDLPDWNCWIDWKANFLALATLMGLFLLIGRLCVGSPVDVAGSRTERSRRYTAAAGLCFVLLLHGLGGACLLLLAALANFALSSWLIRWTKGCRRRARLAMLVVWASNLAALLAMFWLTAEDHGPGNGVRLQRLMEEVGWPRWLGFQGLGPWHSYRFTCLRFISFSCDAIMAAVPDAAPLSSRFRAASDAADTSANFVARITEQERSLQEYHASPRLYLSYVTYPPLYFAGPFLSYNAYAAQQETAASSNSSRDISGLALGLLGYWAVLEMLQHLFLYPGWVGSHAPVETLLAMPAPEIATAMHVMLNFEWMSLLVVWRFNRIIALIDGVDTFENMSKNINLVCSFQGLWKHWHASLNKFCVRYIYVPLGGSKRPLVGVLVTFFFVALWHEVNGLGTGLHWYTWAALNCVCVLLEKLVVSKLPPMHYLGTAAVGAATYLVMQSVQLHALMEWDVACALGTKLLASWAIGLPPVLYGLQKLAGEGASKASSSEPRRPVLLGQTRQDELPLCHTKG